MIITAFRELVSRRTATGLAALGLLTATLGFMLLASTSKTTEAVLTGDIGQAWQTPFDLLVRPPQSLAPLEAEQGLVRPNYLGGLPGGMTLAQVDAIRQIPGVSVAAPIAVVGVVQTTTSAISVDLSGFVGKTGVTAFRVSATDYGQSGLSTYPWDQAYIVVAPTGERLGSDIDSPMRIGDRVINCSYTVMCYGTRFCNAAGAACQDEPLHWPIVAVRFPQPLMIVGVDPAAENALAGLDKCTVTGRPLAASDRLELTSGTGQIPTDVMPMIAATHSFVDESVQVQIDQAVDPAGILNNAPESVGIWQPVLQQKHTADELYQAWLADASKGIWATSIQVPGDVHYVQTATDHLAAGTVTPDLSAFGSLVNITSEQIAPIEARDTWFRTISVHQWINSFGPGEPAARPDFVGRYEPTCLSGFASTAGGQMDSYSPPTVVLPDGSTLGPTRNPADYVNNAPTLITTLDAAQYFARPDRFAGGLGDKFISAIRVRVSGTDQPGLAAQARLSRVAADIHDATGLRVDIVKGSSPKTVLVDLKAGNFGRPALTVKEGWSVIGVGFRFLQATSLQNLLIFSLVLLAAALLVAQTAYVSVRRRRSELAVLRAIGWPPWRIAILIELEMLILGLGVGTVGLALGLFITSLAHLGPTWWTVVGVVPLSLLIALLAGFVPAVSTMRGTTISVMSKLEPIRERQLPSSALALGLRQVTAWRWDVAMGVTALALGATLLGVIELIAAGFRGQLDTTLLGTYLSGQVRPFHFVVAGLTLAVGAIAAAQVITLTYLERRTQLAMLRALGWSRSEVVKMLLGQAIGLGLIAATIAVAATIAAGLALSASPTVIVGAVATALGMSIVTTGIAVVAPLSHAYAADPAAGLRGE
jgi:putative ABC transport system permease protein